MKKIILLGIMLLLLVSCNSEKYEVLENENRLLIANIEDSENTIADLNSQLDAGKQDIEDIKAKLVSVEEAHANELSNKLKLIDSLKEKIETVESVVKELEEKETEVRISIYEKANREVKAFRTYFTHTEELMDLSRQELNALMTTYLLGSVRKLVYTEYDYFSVDYNGVDPIHNDPIFSDNLKWYRLVTEFDSVDGMLDYFNEWYSKEYATSIVDKLVGEVGEGKQYVIYKNRLFTRPGDMGYSTPYFNVSDCKFSVISKEEKKIALKVLVPLIEEDYFEDFVYIKEYEIEFVKEANGWKINSDKRTSDGVAGF